MNLPLKPSSWKFWPSLLRTAKSETWVGGVRWWGHLEAEKRIHTTMPDANLEEWNTLRDMTKSFKSIDKILLLPHYCSSHEVELGKQWTSWFNYWCGLHNVRQKVVYIYAEWQKMLTTTHILGPPWIPTYRRAPSLSTTNSSSWALDSGILDGARQYGMWEHGSFWINYSYNINYQLLLV